MTPLVDPGIACIAHAYARAEMRVRHLAGWSHNDIVYANELKRRLETLGALDSVLGPGASMVWRAVMGKARRQRAAAMAAALALTVIPALLLPGIAGNIWAGAGGITMVYFKRPCRIRVPDPATRLDKVIGRRVLTKAVRAHGLDMPARAITHTMLASDLRRLLDQLDPEHRQLVEALQTDFSGSVGELIGVAQAIKP
jgi:hypothetical protein